MLTNPPKLHSNISGSGRVRQADQASMRQPSADLTRQPRRGREEDGLDEKAMLGFFRCGTRARGGVCCVDDRCSVLHAWTEPAAEPDQRTADRSGGHVSAGSLTLAEAARAKALSTPLADFNVADPGLFRSDTLWPWFERLRHGGIEKITAVAGSSEFGPYWSVTKHRDIIAVDSDHGTFSSDSELGGIAIQDGFEARDRASFISLDPPMHDAQRRAVAPMFSTASMMEQERV